MSWLIQQLLPFSPAAWASSALQSLAWPAALVVVAAMFRSEVRMVLERLVRLKYHDFEAQFQAELRKSEELATQAAPRRLLDLPSGSRRIMHELDAPASPPPQRDPRGTIEDAWNGLSAAADRAAGTPGVDPIPILTERGHLAAPALLLFDRLRQLRGQMTLRADWSPSPADAERFASMARSLASRLPQAPPVVEGGGA